MFGRYNLVPWRRGTLLDNTADPFRSLQREVDSLFDNFFHGFSLPAESVRGELVTPKLNIVESEKSYHLTLELPGVEEKDIDVSLSDGVLTIKGEKRIEEEQKDKSYHRVERAYGSFQHLISLPLEVDEGAIEASFKNGVMLIR